MRYADDEMGAPGARKMHVVRAHRPSSVSLGYRAIAWTRYGSRSAQAPRFLLSISRRYTSWRRRLRTTRVVTIATTRRVSVYRVLQQETGGG